ncbi:MAG: DNA-3-methyladenine glycosylase [Patescibacteria group bacterium]
MPVLPVSFFGRPALTVARDLLGKELVRKTEAGLLSGMITEVEAYIGPQDKACHAHKGLTPRTEVMFGPPGHWYVYFVYGMYWMLNIVTGEEGYPAAVLIRGITINKTEGIKEIKETEDYVLSGPGKLTRKMQVDRKLNGMRADESSGLWIEDRGLKVSSSKIIRTPRIGVSYAKEWAHKPYRFVLTGVGNNGV